MASKGRSRYIVGEENHKSKMTEADVIEARKRYKDGERLIVMAKEYGVVGRVLWCAVTGRTWKSIPLELE